MDDDQVFLIGFSLGAVGVIGIIAITYQPTWRPDTLQRCIEIPEWCEIEMPRMHEAIQAAQPDRGARDGN